PGRDGLGWDCPARGPSATARAGGAACPVARRAGQADRPAGCELALVRTAGARRARGRRLGVAAGLARVLEWRIVAGPHHDRSWCARGLGDRDLGLGALADL